MLPEKMFSMKLLCDPAIPIPRELTHELLNTVLKVSLAFLFTNGLLNGFVVIATSG
jgi:hypothetical protein